MDMMEPADAACTAATSPQPNNLVPSSVGTASTTEKTAELPSFPSNEKQKKTYSAVGDKPRSTQEIKTELQKIWSLREEWQLIPMGKGYFTLKFANQIDKDIAKDKTVWDLAVGSLRIREWVRNFDPYKENSSLCQVWIRIYNMPVEYWHPEVFAAIGRTLGFPIKLDGASASKDVGSFARMLVEIDLSVPSIDSMTIDCDVMSFYVDFVYEQLPLYCTNCKITGHNLDKCKKSKPDNNKASKEPRGQVMGETTTGTEQDISFKQPKKVSNWKQKQPEQQTEQHSVEQNQFAALITEEEVSEEDEEEQYGPDILETLVEKTQDLSKGDAEKEVDNENDREVDTRQLVLEVEPHQTGSELRDEPRESVEKEVALKAIDHTIRTQRVTQMIMEPKRRGRPPGAGKKPIQI
ncbi:uncharacterized protein LOC131008004 [Salvia miltiorrhiza]|uniref:uncharacterized protein LOC131008004 n=1 Tax=Salvia miltiorrhiza TaxID=226208 RepID=UPI0025ABBDB3|nr:uncharacterized protein LOC131008004 [Salvia miltiorrhiza]